MGIKLITEISEPNFKLADAASNELSILARMDSLFYYVKNQNDQLVIFKHFEMDTQPGQLSSEVKDLLINEDLRHPSIKKVKFAAGNRIYNLLPKRLFSVKHARTVLEQMTTQPIVDIGVDHLDELRVVGSYKIGNQANGILQTFEEPEHFHLASPFIIGCQKIAKLKKEQTVFVHFHKQEMQICVFDRHHLIFYNTFEYQTARDSLYYILLIYEQLSLVPAEIPLYLSGQILADSEIYNLLFRYLKDLIFVPQTSMVKHGTIFEQLSPHFYFDLFSLEYC